MVRWGAMGLAGRWLGRLRLPYLFLIFAALFVVNLFMPDPLPFVDELLLLVATVIFGAVKRPRPRPASPRLSPSSRA